MPERPPPPEVAHPQLVPFHNKVWPELVQDIKLIVPVVVIGLGLAVRPVPVATLVTVPLPLAA
jgi:hypothetical protein